MTNTYKPTVEDAKPLIVYTGKDVNDVHMIDADLLSDTLSDDFTISDDKVHVDFSKTASGESVTADGSYLRSLIVYGKAVQDGTPTPSAPVDVKVAALYWNQQGRFEKLASGSNNVWGSSFNSWTVAQDGKSASVTNTRVTNQNFRVEKAAGHKVLYVLDITSTGTFTNNIVLGFGGNIVDLGFKLQTNIKNHIARIGTLGISYEGVYIYPNGISDAQAVTADFTFSGFHVFDLTQMFGTGNEPTVAEFEAMYPEAYYPYDAGSTQILLKTGTSYTPIDLQGNVLASLPDGTKDVLTVDSTGAVTLEKRVRVFEVGSADVAGIGTSAGNQYVSVDISDTPNRGINSTATERYIILSNRGVAALNANTVGNTYITGNGSVIDIVFTNGTFADKAAAQAWVVANSTVFAYKLATPQTIDLGYIDTAVPDGAEISITAQVTPTIDVSVWSDGAEPIIKMIYDLENDLKPTYISKASFDNFCTELGTFLNATITATYDSTDEEYDFVIESNE